MKRLEEICDYMQSFDEEAQLSIGRWDFHSYYAVIYAVGRFKRGLDEPYLLAGEDTCGSLSVQVALDSLVDELAKLFDEEDEDG